MEKTWIARIELEPDFKTLIISAAKSEGLTITSYLKKLAREDLVKKKLVSIVETKPWKK